MLIQYVLGLINVIICLIMGLIGFKYPLFAAIFEYLKSITNLDYRLVYIIGSLIQYLILELIIV